MLTVVLILQMCTGFLVNSNGSDRMSVERIENNLMEKDLPVSRGNISSIIEGKR